MKKDMMEQCIQKFPVMTEDGEEVAELLTVVQIDKIEYAVYALPGKTDPRRRNIYASYVLKDENGYDTLADITDPADKEKVTRFILSCLPEETVFTE